LSRRAIDGPEKWPSPAARQVTKPGLQADPRSFVDQVTLSANVSMLTRVKSWLAKSQNTSSFHGGSHRCINCQRDAEIWAFEPKKPILRRETLFCRSCAAKHLQIPDATKREQISSDNQNVGEVSLEVDAIVFPKNNYEQVIILREIGGDRFTSIDSGYSEACALWWYLKGKEAVRPLTYACWLSTIKQLGATVESVIVHERRGELWIADLRLKRDDTLINVDIRPSDGLLVALHAGAPFLYTAKLFGQVSEVKPENITLNRGT
jgi:bifunctional DNase/RNase